MNVELIWAETFELVQKPVVILIEKVVDGIWLLDFIIYFKLLCTPKG
jgi:hypothetical protein